MALGKLEKAAFDRLVAVVEALTARVVELEARVAAMEAKRGRPKSE